MSQLEAAVKRDPKNARLHVALGLAYWDHNDYPQALMAFQHAVKVGTESAEAHNWLGVALSEKADLPGAIAALRKAVALDPNSAAPTPISAPRSPRAATSPRPSTFQKALALEPNSLGAQMNLGLALREQGDLDTALDHLGASSPAIPPTPDALRARPDAPSDAAISQARPRVREGAGDRAGAARRLLRARRRAEAAERGDAKAARRPKPADICTRVRRMRRARRSERRARSS